MARCGVLGYSLVLYINLVVLHYVLVRPVTFAIASRETVKKAQYRCVTGIRHGVLRICRCWMYGFY